MQQQQGGCTAGARQRAINLFNAATRHDTSTAAAEQLANQPLPLATASADRMETLPAVAPCCPAAAAVRTYLSSSCLTLLSPR
jgi:hypothetical protein